MLSGSATMASSQSFSMIQRRMLLSPWPASPVNRELPLWTSAILLPMGVSCFILLIMLARNSIWPSLTRVTSEYSGSPACSIMNLRSFMPDLPPMCSRSVFQLLPYGGLLSMKSKVWLPKAFVGECRVGHDVGVGVLLSLDQEVSLADGVGLGVDLLAV